MKKARGEGVAEIPRGLWFCPLWAGEVQEHTERELVQLGVPEPHSG